MIGRLLTISWATLPMSAPRAMQVCRLLAHMPDQGWEAEVVTSRECADAPSEIAERTITALYDRHYARHEVEPRERPPLRGRLLHEWQRWRPSISIRDANWVRRATALAARRLRAESFDALVTFAQPWTDHLVGLRLKKRHPDIPWLAHFSDPWTDSPYYANASPSDKALAAAQERAVIGSADRVVFVTQQTADLVMAKYPPAWRDKVRIVPHGFDAEVFEQIQTSPATAHESQDARRMRVVHTGSLYHGARPVSGLLQALTSLRQVDGRVPIEVRFIGHNPPAFGEEIGQFGLDNLVLLSGPRPWSESVRAAAAADALLVIDAPAANSVFLPSKLVEYLALRKPILGLTPECGASADLLRRLGYAIAAPDDPDAIASCLRELLVQWRAGRLGASLRHDQVAAGYEARSVAAQFASLLGEMTGYRGPVATQAACKPSPGDAAHIGPPGRPSTERLAILQTAIVSAARSLRGGRLLVVTPHALPEPEIAELLEYPRVGGLIIGKGSQVVSNRFSERVGGIDLESGAWSLPESLGRFTVFLDHRDTFGIRLSLSALKLGITSVVIPGLYEPTWEKHGTVWLLCRSLFNGARRRALKLLPAGLFRRTAVRRDERLERDMRRALADSPLLPPEAFVSNRILLVNSSLGPGGTERQVVNTVVGLHDRGTFDLSVLCDHLTPGSRDFHVKTMEEIGVVPAERSRVIVGELARSLEPHASRLKRIVRRLPAELSIDVALYAAEFLRRRPAVVHAWQDDTSIKAGLAAAIVGVPRIVLSGRSVAPHHFLFHQPYMRSSYRALCDLPNVVMVNNSNAGAQDYAMWLGLPPERIRVVHNGFDFIELRRPDDAVVSAYRARIGFAPDQPVVGTIMRLSEEKRPLLWLETAASLMRNRPDLGFIMIGTGVMQPEVAAAIDTLGLKDRLVLMAVEQNSALALAAMDAFLLTSRKEGLPNVLIEAQSLGVPVISTDGGGAAETFQNGDTGWLVSSDKPDDIAVAVLSALDDKPWRANAIALAPRLVRQRFSVDRMIDDTCELYGTAERAMQALESRPSTPHSPAHLDLD